MSEKPTCIIDVVHDKRDHRRLYQLLVSEELWPDFKKAIEDAYNRMDNNVEFRIKEDFARILE